MFNKKIKVMSATISNPKEKLLLGAGLDVLHFESREWLDTINFWEDEVRFFDILLKEKVSTDESKQQYAKMLKDLDKIHADLFEYLEGTIIEHEKLLSRIEKGERGLSDADYRDKHRHIMAEMNIFKNSFKTFKKIVFEYVKSM
jgi:hypothetical protein